MSSKQSDENKLLASIHKTRDSGSSATRSASQTKGKTVVKKTVRKAVKKKAAGKTRSTQQSANRDQKQSLINSFQSGRRVWPD